MPSKAQENALKIVELLEDKLDTKNNFKYIENNKIPDWSGSYFDTTRYLKSETSEGKEIIFLMTREYTKSEAESIKFLTSNKEKFSKVTYIFLKGDDYFRSAKNGSNPVKEAKIRRNGKLVSLNEEEMKKTLNLSYTERNATLNSNTLTYFNPENETLENYKVKPIFVPEFNENLFRITEYSVYSKKYFLWTDKKELDRAKLDNYTILPSRKKNYTKNNFGLELREPEPTLFD